MTMKRDDKVQIIRDLLADGQGRFSVADLLVKAGSERRARSAIFLAREGGVGLEPIRDGREVTHYISATIGAAQRAAANTAAKAAAATKPAKPAKVVKSTKQVKGVTAIRAMLPKGATPVHGQPTQYEMPTKARASMRGKSPTERLAEMLQEEPAIVAMGKRDLGRDDALEIEEITEQKVA